MDTQTRIAALDRQSRDYLRLAQEAAPGALTAAGAAYQAGYFALVSALSPDEMSAFGDHPNAKSAALGARRLRLPLPDQALAEAGATTYYAPDADVAAVLDDYVAWARRVRAAAGWA
jgi:hypothetical protein